MNIDFLEEKISKKDFVKILSKALLSVFMFSLVPFKFTYAKAKQLFKIKIKAFNKRDLYMKHDWLG